MRRALTALFTLTVIITFGQAKSDSTTEKHFIVLYTTGENWDFDKPYHEQAYFNEHSANLSKLRKTGKISIGARYSDTGMIVLKAENLKKAQALILSDPAVINEIFKAEIHPLYPFYNGCLE